MKVEDLKVGKVYEMKNRSANKIYMYKVIDQNREDILGKGGLVMLTRLMTGEDWLRLDVNGNWKEFITTREITPKEYPEYFI